MDEGVVVVLMIALFCSSFTALTIVLTQRWHGRLSSDSDLTGIQKFHDTPVPRVGGLAILAGIAAASLISEHEITPPGQLAVSSLTALLALAALPAFFAGFVEDLTKKVSVRSRFLATLASAALASWLLGATLSRIDVPGIDYLLLAMPGIALALTAVAVTGVVNAFNIIDGFHGLSSSAVIIILCGLAWIAGGAGDPVVEQIALIGAASTLGFFVVNYPKGRIFLGDGGAYLAGFWVAEIAILLVVRNPIVPAWQVLAVCAFPVLEVIFSIYRKRILRNISPTMPDKLHLHMLVYRRLVWRLVPRNARQPWKRNACVACILGAWIAVSTIVSASIANTTGSALLIILLNALAYTAFYFRLVRGHWFFSRVPTLPVPDLKTTARAPRRSSPPAGTDV